MRSSERAEVRALVRQMRRQQAMVARVFGLVDLGPGRGGAVEWQIKIMSDRGRFDRGENDFLQLCEHLELPSPDAAFWLAEKAGLLRCVECSREDLIALGRGLHVPACNACGRSTFVEVGLSLVGCIYVITAICAECSSGGRES